MTDTLLQSLRDRMLDESEPLAGLLRKCLVLGAETGSGGLRDWARLELNGYHDVDHLPGYRELGGAPIFYDSVSGNTWATNLHINRIQLPERALQHVPEVLSLRQPIDELEKLAAEDSTSMTTSPLQLAEMLWNQDLGLFQSVMKLRYSLPGTAFAGVLGQVRTKLVEIVADLTAGTPLTELPGTAQVDAAVRQHVGRDVYNTTIQAASGPIAIGQGSEAKVEGLSVADVLVLLEKLQEQAGSATNVDAQAEVLKAVAELREELQRDTPETGEVMRRAGRLRTAVEKIGVTVATAAATDVGRALGEMAMSGAFG